MPLVLVSSDSYSTGHAIARSISKVAGYALINQEILEEVAKTADADMDRLLGALDGSPSLSGRGTRIQKKCLACVEQAVLGALLADDVVCQGLAAHLYVSDVSHAIKVRVLTNRADLAHLVAMETGSTREKAAKTLQRMDERRKRWSLEMYGLDETDLSLYDLVLDLNITDGRKAVEKVVAEIGGSSYRPITYSISALRDLELASRVRVVLLADYPDCRVRCSSGTVVVETRVGMRDRRNRVEAIKRLAGSVDGAEYVQVHTDGAAP